jgi:hypothetical protein
LGINTDSRRKEKEDDMAEKESEGRRQTKWRSGVEQQDNC